MKLLFDTHASIWWDGDQSKLSTAALFACQSPANSLHLSLASVWELQIKMQLGKLALRLPLAQVLRDQQQQNGLVLEQVTLEDMHRKHSGSPTGGTILFLAEVPMHVAKHSVSNPDDEAALLREAERLTPIAMTGHPRQEREDVMRASFHAIPQPPEDILGRSPDAEKEGVRLWLLGTNVE